MSRTGKGPKLCIRQARYRDGKIHQRATWVIRDRRTEISTGCASDACQKWAPEEAQRALADYIAAKYSPDRNTRDIRSIPVADALMIYLDNKLDPAENDCGLERRIDRINEFFGGMMLSEINTKSCKEYCNSRPGVGGARRDLEILRAAINFHAAENLHRGSVYVWLPPRGEPRTRWLTRNEAAKMIWTAYRYRELQTIHKGRRRGEPTSTEKRPLRHIARFLLVGCYTGTRASAIMSASITRQTGKSHVDLERGIYYRKPIGKKATKKRQPPAPLPDRLLAHMRRWVRKGIAKEHFVEFNGKPIQSVSNGFARVVRLAEIDIDHENVTPHTLRHTAATWLMQSGSTPLWMAAGYLGMTVETLQNVYGHHHPDYMSEAKIGITTKPKRTRAEFHSTGDNTGGNFSLLQ